MSDRERLAQDFVRAAGWGNATRITIAGDASNRRYDRLTQTDGTTAVLMDAPAEKGEDVRPFITIATHLAKADLSAPLILDADIAHGFLLLEDLGDDLFARVLERDPSLETPLYAAAVDVLVHLHKTAAPSLKRYDAEIMTDMAALAYDWYLMGANGYASPEKTGAFRTAFHAAIRPLDDDRQVLIQRDYHAENLLWLPERDSIARVGLLDFQDAMLGHPAYDLVSILQDARRDVPATIKTEMRTRYIHLTQTNSTSFETAYALLGTQRNLRILGVFARLCMMHGKAHYVDLIPRVWEHIQTNLQHPALASIKPLIQADLPPPTQATMETLKSKCATHPKP